MTTSREVPSQVVVIGAGHNGLVAATLLARAGLAVTVVEAADVVGGACRTETPFAKAPELPASTGAYLLGLMPPELLRILDIDLPLVRRDPHYFLPTTSDRHLLLGSDAADARRQYVEFFSEADADADARLQAELSALREDLAPAWLQEPLSLEETAERFIRPELRSTFLEMCRGSVLDYLARFGFASDLVVAMYAVTDGLTGLDGDGDTAGSGLNFLVHNMCRLPAADGTWMVVRGGMGTVTARIADAARAAGATIRTNARVSEIKLHDGAVTGVALTSGEEVDADVVLFAADPFRLADMLPSDTLPTDLATRIDGWRHVGTTLKVNLALADLPTFTSLPEQRGQHGATIHLLDLNDPLGAVTAAYADARAGRLPQRPPIEWYIHSAVDPALRDADGRHSGALFVQCVPNEVTGSSWTAELDGFIGRLLDICDEFAPGTSDSVVDTFPLPPPTIESHFGITRGHIHHVDNAVGFADRMPYAVGVPGLYAGSAGCHPAGSVIGAAGHNAAQRILSDLAG